MVSGQSIYPKSNRCGLGYWLAENLQGQGVMKRSLMCHMDYLFNEMKLNKLEVFCASENKASRNLVSSIGFKEEGVLRDRELLHGKHIDHVAYGFLKREWASR